MPDWWLIKFDVDQIRRTGSIIYVEGQAIGAETSSLSRAVSDSDAYGSDPISAQLSQFSSEVLPKTLTYFEEVGQATEDMGIAMGEVADAYAEVERWNVRAIGKAMQAVIDLGIC